jgi:hypothetical protein
MRKTEYETRQAREVCAPGNWALSFQQHPDKNCQVRRNRRSNTVRDPLDAVNDLRISTILESRHS